MNIIYELLIDELKSKKIAVDAALMLMVKDGYSPAILHDDEHGNFAVVFDGVQTIGNSDEIEFIHSAPKDSFKKTIREALIYSLEKL